VPALSAGVYHRLGAPLGLVVLGLPLVLSRLLLDAHGGAWMWILQWVAMGPFFVEAFARARSLERAAVGAVVATVLLQGTLLLVKSMEWGQDPWTALTAGIEAAIRTSLRTYGALGMAPDTVSRFQEAAPNMAQAMAVLTPGLFVCMDILLQWWTLLVIRRFPGVWGGPLPGPRNLSKWCMPFPWVWVTIAGGILAILPGEVASAVGINAVLMMGTVHFLQGIAVASDLFRQRRIPSFLRGLFYALVFVQQVFLLGVVAVGLFDIWFDFRRRWGTASET
jgi:uncharacterized protein YybS (DUF2232 family)